MTDKPMPRLRKPSKKKEPQQLEMPIEKPKVASLLLNMPVEVREQFKELASISKTTMNDLLREYIDEFIALNKHLLNQSKKIKKPLVKSADAKKPATSSRGKNGQYARKETSTEPKGE